MVRRVLSVARALLTLLVLVALGVGPGAVVAPAAAAPRPVQVAAPQSPPPRAYVVVDAGTGAILMADRHHDPLPPASTAKVMTALAAVERLAPDALVTVSELAAAQPPSKITMLAGQQWPLPDALASLLLASANDAAYAIAENAGGSLDGFVVAMDETAERLGMQDSTFADPAGFSDDTAFRGGPQMSAFDIAIATRNALAVPELARWGAQREYEFVDPGGRPRSLTNHNKLLPGGTRAYQWATGFKPGYTEKAGHTLTATATRDGRTLIAVVLNTYDTYGWAAQLFEQGFAMPQPAGQLERLPAVAVSPYGARIAAQQAFLALTTPPSTSAPTTPTSTSVEMPSTVDSAPIADTGGNGDASDGGGGLFLDAWLLVVIAVTVVVLGVVLRRRVVRRQRARRVSLQRARAARMRSGSLTVIDGRFRPGDRTGPPVESHVRIREDDDD